MRAPRFRDPYREYLDAYMSVDQPGGRQGPQAAVRLYRACIAALRQYARSRDGKPFNNEIGRYIAWDLEEVLAGRWPDHLSRARLWSDNVRRTYPARTRDTVRQARE